MRWHIVATALWAVALVLLVAGQSLPSTHDEDTAVAPGGQMGGMQLPPSTFHVVIEFGMWGYEVTVNGDDDHATWYNDDFDDADGVAALRTAPILLIMGMVAGVAGTALAWCQRTQPTAPWAFVLAAALTFAAVATHMVGLRAAYEEDTPTWAVAIPLLWAGASATLAAAFAAPAAWLVGRRAATAPPPTP